MQVRVPWAAALVLAAMSACGPYDYTRPGPPRFLLEGSLGQVMDIGYDDVKVLVAPQDVSVVFSRRRARAGLDAAVTSEDVVLKLSARRINGEPFPSRARVDLTEEDGAMNQRGVFTRNVVNDPRTTFPKLRISTVYFDKALMPGVTVRGDFHGTFEGGIEPASGRTVFGSFLARVF